MGPDEPAKTRDGKAVSTDAEGRKIWKWQVSELLGEGREAIIEHAGQEYRLRITANNKLILTK